MHLSYLCFSLGIGNNHKKELKSFSLDSRALTSFELANSLWDLIGESFQE